MADLGVGWTLSTRPCLLWALPQVLKVLLAVLSGQALLFRWQVQPCLLPAHLRGRWQARTRPTPASPAGTPLPSPTHCTSPRPPSQPPQWAPPSTPRLPTCAAPPWPPLQGSLKARGNWWINEHEHTASHKPAFPSWVSLFKTFELSATCPAL